MSQWCLEGRTKPLLQTLPKTLQTAPCACL
uniref:Uncharacterized protein n=1 Tax=Anguilla anguilla TaxID=7936 RepID=A0A0E9PVA0_ANGAN